MKEKAIILLSGGADSVTCLAVAARRERRACLGLSFVYGQVHQAEVDAAAVAAAEFGAEHRMVTLDPALFAASALTGTGEIPQGRGEDEIGGGVPSTYVPARNLVFLSLATALAETVEASYIYIGVNALDYSGYPDCRPEFIAAYQRVVEVGTKAGALDRPLRVVTPLAGMTKAEIFALGADLGVDYARTISCYAADEQGRACGACDSCTLRRRGFREAGLPDPTVYQR